MFKNPVARSILLSSGSIPVRRNPNGGTGAKGTSPSTSQESLFRETSAALAEGRVVGVFPEGTSYTEPGLAQLREGAAWAAVDYLRWTRHHEGKLQCREGLTIVPTAIVYTDKSQYQSRVSHFAIKHIVLFIRQLTLSRTGLCQVSPLFEFSFSARIANAAALGMASLFPLTHTPRSYSQLRTTKQLLERSFST